MQVVYENTFISRAEDGTFAQSGSVALEPKAGGVRGVVGQVADNDKQIRNFQLYSSIKT